MNIREWLEKQMQDAGRAYTVAQSAMDMAKARHDAFRDTLNNLPVEQMENIQVAASAAKEN
jgi:hypothetical protein